MNILKFTGFDVSPVVAAGVVLAAMVALVVAFKLTKFFVKAILFVGALAVFSAAVWWFFFKGGS
ncbi:MAG: hypothetical protein AAB676_03435 [Verrucomicrobiota bacterium]